MKKIYLLILLSIFTTGIFAQSGFQNSYGDTMADDGTVIIKSSLDFYVLVGTTYLPTVDSTEVAVYFINEIGDLTASRRIGLPGYDTVTSVVESIDENFIITGYSTNSPLDTGNSDIFATKVNNFNGDVIWTHFYGGQGEDKAYDIIMTPDSNYLIAGSTRSHGPFDQSALALKIDDNGDMLWCKITGIGVETEYKSATISADTEYILGGTATDGNGSDHYITKMRSDGTIVWTNQVGSVLDESTNEITPTADGGFIIAGNIVNPGSISQDMLITKLDTGGAFVWANSYSTVRDEGMMSVIQNTSGNYVACGYTNTDTTGVVINHLTLMQLDPSGNIIWSNVYGDITGLTDGRSVIQSIDDGYAATGVTFTTGDPDGDAFLVKTDTAGFSGCAEEMPWGFTTIADTMTLINAGFEDIFVIDTILTSVNSNTFYDQWTSMCFWDAVKMVQTTNNILLYPNPVSESFTLEGEYNDGLACIYDALGQQVKIVVLSGNKNQLVTSELLPGLYFVRISSNDLNTTLKFIKE